MQAFRADLLAEGTGQSMNIGAWLDNDEEFSPFQYTYEGMNFATWDRWANYLLSTPGAYQEVTAQFRAYTENVQYGKVVSDYMAYENVSKAKAEAVISPANPIMEGGHWNFAYGGSDPELKAGSFRVPGSTLHSPALNSEHPGPHLHADTFNPTPIWRVWNLAAHGLIDYVGGHTLFSEGFTF